MKHKMQGMLFLLLLLFHSHFYETPTPSKFRYTMYRQTQLSFHLFRAELSVHVPQPRCYPEICKQEYHDSAVQFDDTRIGCPIL